MPMKSIKNVLLFVFGFREFSIRPKPMSTQFFIDIDLNLNLIYNHNVLLRSFSLLMFVLGILFSYLAQIKS